MNSEHYKKSHRNCRKESFWHIGDYYTNKIDGSFQ